MGRALLAWGILLAPLARAQEVDPDARAALRKLGERMKDAKTLSAHVVQSRKTALLDEPIVSSGTLYYRKEPARLVFRLTSPQVSEVHLDASAYQVYRPDEKRLERFEFEDQSISGKLLLAFQPKADEIGKAFSIRKGASRPGEVEIVLEPTDPKVRKRIVRLALTLDEKDSLLRRIATVDADGDEIRFDLSEVTIDPPLDPATFELRVPEGTRVLKQAAKLEK
jgi:outer membrane lipoprotein-sorting protein